MREIERLNKNAFIEQKILEIRRTIGQEKALAAVSGGVDSSTCAVLTHRAIGKQLEMIFIDDGLMRKGEPQKVLRTFEGFGLKLEIVEAQDFFFAALVGKTDPEEKRKAFREAFYQTLAHEAQKREAAFLVQGTIKADIIETQKAIKTQHNVLEQIGIDPQKYGFKVVEPLKDFFKDQVREIAKYLGLPKEIYERMPFPGPGLATRIVGEVTPERVATVRQATAIVEEELREFFPFQAFAVLLSDQATGVKEDKRVFGQIIVIRAVDSEDAMTASVSQIPLARLSKIQERIVAKVPGVNRVLFDLTPKPPATIEYI